MKRERREGGEETGRLKERERERERDRKSETHAEKTTEINGATVKNDVEQGQQETLLKRESGRLRATNADEATRLSRQRGAIRKETGRQQRRVKNGRMKTCERTMRNS